MVRIANSPLLKLLASGYDYSRRSYVLSLALSAIFGLTVPLFVQLQKAIIDTAIIGTPGRQMVYVLLPAAVGYLVFHWINAVGSDVSVVVNARIMHDVEKIVMRRYLDDVSRLEFQAFENAEIQNVLMRLSQSQREAYFKTVTFFPNIFRRLIELGGVFYFVAVSGVWWAFPLSIVISLPSFYFNRKRIEYALQARRTDSFDIRYADYLNETLLNREAAVERRFFGFSNYLSGLWTNAFSAHNEKKIRTFVRSSVATGIAMCFSASIIVVLGLALLIPLQSGGITIGLYAAILLAASTMNGSVAAIAREYSNIADINHFLEDSRTLARVGKIDVPAVISSGKDAEPIRFESIAFEDVWFAYPHASDFVLKGVTFEISGGEHHALIGLNGAGKSTIAKLMLGLYPPSKGEICLNGRDIRSYSAGQLQALFAAVQQNFAKYKDTLGVNVALYDVASGDLDAKRINETLLRCETDDLISKCNDDYGTILTPEFSGGIMLSGGEWQKVAFSRALHSQRDFIIFDEPTAALDPLAEIRFYDTYNRIMDGFTCLFITHRLGSTHLFASCFVLADGEIAESGSHVELMQRGGIYKELYDKQKAWYDQQREMA